MSRNKNERNKIIIFFFWLSKKDKIGRENTTKKDKIKEEEEEEEEKNRVEFVYLERALNDRLFTGAIPLLFDAGAFACCDSTLGRFAPL